MNTYATLKAFLLWFNEQVAAERLYPADRDVAIVVWMAAAEHMKQENL